MPEQLVQIVGSARSHIGVTYLCMISVDTRETWEQHQRSQQIDDEVQHADSQMRCALVEGQGSPKYGSIARRGFKVEDRLLRSALALRDECGSAILKMLADVVPFTPCILSLVVVRLRSSVPLSTHVSLINAQCFGLGETLHVLSLA